MPKLHAGCMINTSGHKEMDMNTYFRVSVKCVVIGIVLVKSFTCVG